MKIAFTPVVYEHAARFVGRTPWDVSRDAELMFAGHRNAYLEYRQQVIAVGIDIYNLEAEAYGGVWRTWAGMPSRRFTSRCSNRPKRGPYCRSLYPSGMAGSPWCWAWATTETGVPRRRRADSRGWSVLDRVQPPGHHVSVRRRRAASRRNGPHADASGREPGRPVPGDCSGRAGRRLFRVCRRAADPFTAAVSRGRDAGPEADSRPRIRLPRASRTRASWGATRFPYWTTSCRPARTT